MYKCLLILMMVLSIQIHAKDTTKIEQEQSKAEIALLKENFRILEAQNEILRGSAHDIQIMYLSALGFSATFLITFLGVNVYFSRTKFEEERKSLESLYEAKSKEQLLRLEEAFHCSIKEFNENIPSTLEQKIKPLTNAVELQSKRLNAEELRVDLELLMLNIKVTTTEATLVRMYIEAASLANKMKQDWRVGDFLLEADKLLSKGVKIGSLSFADTIGKLKAYPEHHEILVTRIKEKLVANKQVE